MTVRDTHPGMIHEPMKEETYDDRLARAIEAQRVAVDEARLHLMRTEQRLEELPAQAGEGQ